MTKYCGSKSSPHFVLLNQLIIDNLFILNSSCSAIRENTIASMQNAVLHGADMIEFDVQLSKDMIPVIYHDFELCLSTDKRHNGEKHLVEIPLKSLTLEQLHELRVME